MIPVLYIDAPTTDPYVRRVTVGHIDDKGNREGTAQAYAILFEQTHPRFDRAKFEAYVEEVHADCWADDGPTCENGV